MEKHSCTASLSVIRKHYVNSSNAHLTSLSRRLRLEDGELQASQGYTAGPCLKVVLKPVSEAGEEGRNT